METRHGNTITFPEFLSAHAVNSFGSNVMNYGLTLARYAEQFGLSNISLVSYSNIVDAGGDLFINFCQNFLSWNDPPAPSHGRVNVSLDPVEVEIIRALNAIERARGGEQSTAIFRSYRHSKGKLDLTKLNSGIQSYLAHSAINEGLGPLQYLHSELFRQFGPLLVEPRTGPRLFVPRLSQVPYVRQDYLLSQEVAATIQAIYKEICGEAV
jgi:hypothetical protein